MSILVLIMNKRELSFIFLQFSILKKETVRIGLLYFLHKNIIMK